MASNTESSRRPRPTPSQLLHWRQGPETKWVMDHLAQQFRPRRPQDLPVAMGGLSPWEAELVTVGNQQVLAAIEKLCEPQS